MSEAEDVRHLTRRGFKRPDSQVPPEGYEPPEDSAPEWQPERPNLDDWGVSEAEARDLLSRQMCPVCGQGPWSSPLNHVARKHGIDRHVMRDVCGLSYTVKVTDEAARAKWSANGSNQSETLQQNAEDARGKPKRRRRTRAFQAFLDDSPLLRWVEENPEAAAQVRADLSVHGHTPEATAKQAAKLRENWAAMTDEERAARLAHVKHGPDGRFSSDR